MTGLSMLLLAAVSTFIGVSETDPNYFQTREGKTWVPVGCNICFERMGLSNDEARAFACCGIGERRERS